MSRASRRHGVHTPTATQLGWAPGIQIRAELLKPYPETLYLRFCPVCFTQLSLDPLFRHWGSAAVKLDHFFLRVVVFDTLGYCFCLDLVEEDRSRLRTVPQEQQ